MKDEDERSVRLAEWHAHPETRACALEAEKQEKLLTERLVAMAGGSTDPDMRTAAAEVTAMRRARVLFGGTK
jgi:hypothetical protein